MKYLEWGKQYGPMTWAVVPGRKFLILNSYEAITELLDKRGNNYINRPVGVMANKLVGEHVRPFCCKLIHDRCPHFSL